MTATRPHLVYITIDEYGEIRTRVECPGVDVGGCQTVTEGHWDGPWPGPHQCNCVALSCEACTENEWGRADHDRCESEDWPSVPSCVGGPACGLIKSDLCGVNEYQDSPQFAERTWPETCPILADVKWVGDDDIPMLVPWIGDVEHVHADLSRTKLEFETHRADIAIALAKDLARRLADAETWSRFVSYRP